ncbi:Uu.00g097510.m01.CDS01 [Anthostomella pinea]|uniref:Uu.00g097510.m01.CDS01 n=1 Tax=Anthostomella pinea TaxID=933095 RepID=A0AAI8VCY9_9PEZI|nr:Uu.00g097510.m01.CDS01 [Anthostomella pinea]
MPTNKSANDALAGLAKGGEKLGLVVGGKNIEPGQYIPKAEAQTAPEISLPNAGGEYIVVSLDMDAPFPSFNLLGPIHHWTQPGFTPTTPGEAALSSGNTPFIANYIGPAPPPGSGPHRYVFFLYQQPEAFDGKAYAPPNGQTVPNMKRMRYDLDDFEQKAKLGPIVACNYFTSN